MRKHPAVTRARVRRVLEHHVAPAVHGAIAPLEVAALHIHGEPVSAEDALAQAFEPFEVGGAWGAAWDTTWFRLRGTIPPQWAGCEVAVLVGLGYAGHPGFGAEALVWKDGVPVQGISPQHQEHVVTRRAEGGEAVELHLEAAANPPPPWTPVWPLLMPDPGGRPLFRLDRAELAVVHRDVYSFWTDFRTLLELAEHLPEDEPRGAEILFALNEACNLLDLDDVRATVERASKPLGEMLARPAAPSAHRVSAVGHAHIDTAWLWPLRETVRKCARTFATALRLMEEYPEYRFVCSQAQHFEWMKDGYPALFEGIRRGVEAGRFEPVGSMWVEADCNIPSGESLVRQILHGKRFFLRELGYETADVWLPDVFGYSAALPQIMAQAGIRYFLTQKISWNDTNRFPHHTFLWEGIDGTRVFTHFPPADTYNATFAMSELIRSVRSFREHGRATRSLYVFGYSDGGGGPTRDMIETARRVADLEGAPRVEPAPALDFFRKAEADARDLPVWSGELYLEYHRGTYTTQARTKRANRRSELLLREAELWSCVRSDPWASYPAEELGEAWKSVLVHQFHDIIPGTSIHWVYEDAARAYERVRDQGERARDRALAALAGEVDTSGTTRPIVVFNSLSFERTEVVAVPAPEGPAVSAAVGAGGEVGDVQQAGDRLLFAATVPACGYALYDLTAGPAPAEPGVEVGEASLENEALRVAWDADGLLTSVWDKRAGREALAPGARGNLFQLHPDYPNSWDAWDVDPFYREQVTDLTALDGLEVAEGGPVRAGVRLTRRFGSSSIVQTMRLAAGSRRLEFETEIDWHESHRLLKVAFPVNVRSMRASFEIQFGHVERPTHENTSWDLARFEVCAHRWADLSEPGYGVALLNDCKYGHDVLGGVLRLSLLRAPTWPDPEADRGRHELSYALLPHPDDLQRGRVIEEAHALNQPLVAVPSGLHGGPRPCRASFVSVDRRGVVIDAVKKAEDEDAVVVRLYEAWGARGPAVVRAPQGVGSAVRTDLLERDQGPVEIREGGIRLEFRPFEIVTLKLRP